ncbi:MAG: DNA polymerase IV [Bacteroidetes bacterium]|nr:DNA polymerase IV [Bacteroidota bacterium]
MILHLDLDTFFVSCERLVNPELIGKPVIIGGLPTERGVVAACSYEARQFGVYSSMPLRWAAKACPQAIFMHGTRGLYSTYSKKVTAIIRDFAPRYEKASVDEFYLDISGLYQYIFRSPVEVARLLQKNIDDQLGLPSSCGIGRNRLIAKIGSRLAKPHGIFFVPPGSEEELLSPLPISIIPGIGDSMESSLHKRGIRLVRDLQAIPESTLMDWYGKYGSELFQKAHGIGRATIDEEQERKSVSSETTFHEDSSDPVYIRKQFLSCVQETGFTLRKHQLKGLTLTLKLRDSTFETHTYAQTLPYAINDDYTLINRGLELLQTHLTPEKKIRLVGFGVSRLVHANDQADDLFSGQETDRFNRLSHQIDLLKTKFGKRSLGMAG